jgi:hypothetical protein
MSKHYQTSEEFIRYQLLKSQGDLKLASSLVLTPIERDFINYLLQNLPRDEAAFRASNSSGRASKHPRSNTKFWQERGYKLSSSQRVKDYLASIHQEYDMAKLLKPITIENVVGVLHKLLHDESLEPKDRIKSGEILLKHLGGFKQHQEARAPKHLTIINNLTPAEIDKELENVSLALNYKKDETIHTVETEEYYDDENEQDL